MSSPLRPHGTLLPGFLLVALPALVPVGLLQANEWSAETALAALHPDYRSYVDSVRPLENGARAAAGRVYMALVRPGASDPGRKENAPFAGPGARNDILYDPMVLDGNRSAGWVQLLLDHEYFHARHLAGATTLPLPPRSQAALERHFYEAAAWGFNVAQARAGRYGGLREEEFREALDRYGQHYRALRDLAQSGAPATWLSLESRLRQLDFLLTKADSPPRAALARPSDSD